MLSPHEFATLMLINGRAGPASNWAALNSIATGAATHITGNFASGRPRCVESQATAIPFSRPSPGCASHLRRAPPGERAEKQS